MDFGVVFGIGAVAVVLIVALIVRLYFSVNKINSSIAKLGYVIREDAKKYFDEAAVTITETNETSRKQSVTLITEASRQALAESGAVMEQTLATAHQQAGSIILKAREDAKHILEAAQAEAEQKKTQVLNASASTIDWMLEQYTGQNMSVSQHEALIQKLLNEYINENRN